MSLFVLPEELRKRIYEEILTPPGHLKSVTISNCQPSSCTSNRPAILRTCRLCHKEATPLLYRFWTFLLSPARIPESDRDIIRHLTFRDWLRQLNARGDGIQEWLARRGRTNTTHITELVIQPAAFLRLMHPTCLFRVRTSIELDAMNMEMILFLKRILSLTSQAFPNLRGVHLCLGGGSGAPKTQHYLEWKMFASLTYLSTAK